MTPDYPARMDSAPREPGPKEIKYRSTARGALIGLAVAVCLALAILLGFAAYTSYTSSRSLQAIEDGQKSGHTLLNTINDCTQPTGKCYKRGQRRTASAVSSINQVVILAAACASGLPPGLTVESRQAEIQTCVINRLARHQH